MLNLMIIDDEPIILAGIRDMVEQERTPFTRISVAFSLYYKGIYIERSTN
ncbi:hypothetical protein C7820_3005 [Paenibacillus sp. VMFN-D1]|nr:hypothetical protein C7820_3005 [Paenibacillus sp. VMFN-D1]